MQSYTKPAAFQSNTDSLDYSLPISEIEKQILTAHEPRTVSEISSYLDEVDKARTKWACISSKTQRKAAGAYRDFVEIQSYHNVTDFKFSYPAIKNTMPPSRSGKTIHKFSKKSRSRLLKKSKMISRENEKLPFFITLTYQENFTDCEAAKTHLNAFLQRFRRIGKTKYIWKMEFQKRGAIHFHLLLQLPGQIYPVKWQGKKDSKKIELIRMKVSSFWNEITKQSSQNLAYGQNVRSVLNWKMATGYLAKYMGKEQQPIKDEHGKIIDTGRFWGMSRNWNLDPVLSCSIDAEKMDLVKEILKNASFISFNEYLNYAKQRLNEFKRMKDKKAAAQKYYKLKEQVKRQRCKFEVDMLKIDAGKMVTIDIDSNKIRQLLNEFDLFLNVPILNDRYSTLN